MIPGSGRAGRTSWLALLALAGGLGACQERLTAPADCPELCPGGSAEVFDLALAPRFGSDSSYPGYVDRREAITLLVSNGLPAAEARAVYRFTPRGDSIACFGWHGRSPISQAARASAAFMSPRR